MASVAVIGAGVIGAAIADAMAARGARVTLFDMRGAGRGASHASAGVLSPYIEATPGSVLLALGTRSLAMWDDFAARVRARGGDFEYARTGTLEVALTDDEARHLQEQVAWLTAEGVAHRWLEPAQLRAHEPAVTPAALGGLQIDGHGFVHVPALVRALLQAARLQGATLETPAEVLHVEPAADGVALRQGDTRRRFDHVVIAAGSWSSRVKIAGATLPKVRPIRGQLLELGWRDAAMPQQSTWGTKCYTVPWKNNHLLVGATVEDVGFDESTTVDGVRGLLAAVTELLPGAAAAELVDVRVGLRPIADSKIPLIGPVPGVPHVTVATAHYRNGILLAPYTADVISRLVLDGDADPALAMTTLGTSGAGPS
ncbi:MAG: glycine oxidase ThiO [Vicinamibacterales bacterium]